jgi:dipeptidyl aminopeptidase/acylaminoacyl peptidase
MLPCLVSVGMRGRKRFLVRAVVVLATAYMVFSLAGGLVLAEMQLHPHRRADIHTDEAARIFAARLGGHLDSVQIEAADGVPLRAWYARPPHANGRDVLLLHGVQDNRNGVSGFAFEFMRQGYGVLLPDSRAHGESGGNIATYGLRESDDIHRWVSWLYGRENSQCVYGFGESMGAALLLDSLAVEHRFCAAIAESPFSSFRGVAYERAALYVGAPTWVGETVLRLPVEIGMIYARLRYGLDFDKDSPIDAIAGSATPILLIHGEDDINILPRHSGLIAARYPERVVLWNVPGAAHCEASGVDPIAFWRTVLGWLDSHRQQPAAAANRQRS